MKKLTVIATVLPFPTVDYILVTLSTSEISFQSLTQRLPTFQYDPEDSSSLILFGGAALAALWLTTTIVGAIDSVPLVCTSLCVEIDLFVIFKRKKENLSLLLTVLYCIIFQFPKLLELVGLGYTLWFSARYLLFKVIAALVTI